MKSEPVKVTVNGIGAVSDFDGSITPEMTGTISLKAFGNASTPTVPAGYPKITPSSEGINLTESGNNTYSLTIDKAKAVAGDYTIDFGNGITYTFTVVNETVIVDVDGEEIKAVATPGQNIELDLTEAIGSDEIAIITDGNGNKIYDVNDDTLTPPEGYKYDKDSNTLTVTVAEGNDANIDIIAKRIKASLYDAVLTITDGKYTTPDLSSSTPKGKYDSVAEAYKAAKDMDFSNGVYIQITKDLKENFSGDGLDQTFMTKPVTFDLNDHKWESNATKTRIINISLAAGNVFNFVGGSFENSDLVKGSDYLGGAMYLLKTGTELIGGNDWPSPENTKNGWATVNIFDTDFKNNYADCGGAICVNGAVKLNIYNSEFDGNKSLENPLNGRKESGAAIYIYESGTSGPGEIVSLYDCTFTNNSGMNLFAVQAKNRGSYFNIYGGKFSGNTLYGNGAIAYLSAFNIYGGSFTNNSSANANTSNPSSFLVAEENSTAKPDFTIAGGIVSNNTGATYGFNIGNASNADRITFSGGSFGAMVSGGAGSSTSFTPSNKTIVNATLTEAKKVEYISYTINGDTVNININSPFKFDENGDVVYKFEIE